MTVKPFLSKAYVLEEGWPESSLRRGGGASRLSRFLRFDWKETSADGCEDDFFSASVTSIMYLQNQSPNEKKLSFEHCPKRGENLFQKGPSIHLLLL